MGVKDDLIAAKKAFLYHHDLERAVYGVNSIECIVAFREALPLEAKPDFDFSAFSPLSRTKAIVKTFDRAIAATDGEAG